jgi:glycosyltransferase involved in cell wall biosynthesis
MCRLIEEEHIEFLHTTQINGAAELAARKMKIPHLMNIYQLTEEEFAFKQTDFYPRYHLCDSEMYSALWSRKLNMVSECMRPLSPLDKQREYRKTFKKQQTIVMVGLLCERKNQLTAIRAVEKLQDKTDLRLIIAGDCDNTYGKKCRDYVEEHNLQKRVLFSGFVLDVGELLEEADGFLLASTDESFPSSIVEAVSYGVPILTTPVGGVPEVFINHVNAFV